MFVICGFLLQPHLRTAILPGVELGDRLRQLSQTRSDGADHSERHQVSQLATRLLMEDTSDESERVVAP
eukprot:SAG31_NODE_6886_length_1860_cov_1.583759_3_plen_69_part_00